MLVAITGANRGIGLELTKKYVEKGDKVFAMCRRVSDELKSLDNVQIVEGIDTTDFNLKQKLESTFGNEKIDLFINNAGVLTSESLNSLNFDDIR